MPVLQTGSQFRGETLVNGEVVTLVGAVSGTQAEYVIYDHLGVGTSATYYNGAGSGDYITGAFDGPDAEGNRWKGVFDVVITDRPGPPAPPVQAIQDVARSAGEHMMAVADVFERGSAILCGGDQSSNR